MPRQHVMIGCDNLYVHIQRVQASLTRVFRMCKTGLHPLYVNVEIITPDHHVVSRHDELSQWCILRENTYTLKFSEGSSYNATTVLSKIRCIKDKHHMQSKYVTWYGHHHLVPLISISKVPSWSPSHRHDTMISIILISINVSSHGRLANYCFCNYCYRIAIK